MLLGSRRDDKPVCVSRISPRVPRLGRQSLASALIATPRMLGTPTHGGTGASCSLIEPYGYRWRVGDSSHGYAGAATALEAFGKHLNNTREVWGDRRYVGNGRAVGGGRYFENAAARRLRHFLLCGSCRFGAGLSG